jgi:aminopeptidase N
MKLFILLIILLHTDLFPVKNTSIGLPAELKYFCSKEGYNSVGNNRLMINYDVKFYKLDLEASDTSTYLSGSATVLVEAIGEPFNEFVLELLDSYTVDSVLVDGVNSNFVHQNNEIVISSYKAHEINSLVNLQVFYSGSAESESAYTGIYNRESYHLGKNITWTLSEPFYARNWFPCKQELTDKADSVHVFVTTDSRLKAGSNGILTSTVPLPGDKVRYEWKSRYPIAYYLISIAVGEYVDYSFWVNSEGLNDSILVQNYLYNNEDYINQNKEDIDRTGEILIFYSDKFGQYPFAGEKYGHAVAPLGGGMEHQTMTTINNFTFNLVAHELAHQWFGNNVTCATWHDIWINEGFASYSEYLANEFLVSYDKARLWMADAHDFVLSQPDGSVYVPAIDMEDHRRIFDSRLSYKKGAAIIHMIRHEVQDDSLFFTVLKEFQSVYKDSTATGMDFKNILEEITEKDFTAFFNQWYFGEGHPSLNVNWNVSNDTLCINSLQTSSSPLNPLFNNLTEYKITFIDRDTSLLLRQQSNYDQYKIPVNRKVVDLKVDPDKWLLMRVNVQNYYNIDKKFTIKPNPARDRLEIQFNLPIEDYKIYITDISGRIINNFESSKQNYQLDLDSLSKGLYFLIINENNKIYSSKFIKI